TKLYSRPDNVWCSEGLAPLVVRCDVDSYLQPPFTDHFPIITIVELPQERVVPTPSFNFRKADWAEFTLDLTENVIAMPEPRPLGTSEEIQDAAAALTQALQESIRATIALNKPCPHSRRWWSPELDILRREVNQMSRVVFRNRAVPLHHSHAEHRQLSNAY
ncbi:hypothetical protein HYPSUDRAFT_102675, partial [Hypholoma sublateritium FD-334 SS-4]